MLKDVVVFLLVALGTAFSTHAQTATNTWDGGATGNQASRAGWTSDNNWNPNSAPIAGSMLIFNGVEKLTANTNTFAAGFGFYAISFASSAGGFTLTGNSISLTNGITNTSANTQTLNLDGITLGVAQTFNASAGNLLFTSLNNINTAGLLLTVTGGFNTTFDSIISGGGGLTKTGAGEVALNGGNTYTGTTSINGGTIALGNAGSLGGNGSVSFGGGTLRYSAANTADLSSRITGSSGAIAIDTAGQNVTFASTLAAGNTGGLTKSGAGTLTLSAANAYTGATTMAGGTLSVGADNNLGAAPGSPTAGSLTFSNGTLLATAGFTLDANRGIALGTGGGTFNVSSGQAVSSAGTITGSGNLTKAGAGTLVLSGANSYSGTTTLSAGTLRAANASALGAAIAGDALALNGGRLELASDANATFGPGTGYGTTVGGNVTIALDRLTSGAAVAQQLGTLSIGGQTLSLERGANATSGTAALVIGGATTLTGNATFAAAANTELRFDNTLAGAFNITKTGDGILTLNRGGGQADNTITGGQLNINHFQALGTSPGTLSLAGGVTIDNTATNSVTVGNAKSISLGSTLTFLGTTNLSLGSGTTTLTNNTAINVVANTLTLGGNVTGAFGLTKNGAGTLELSGLTGAGSFSGNSVINAGELFLSGPSVFGGDSNTMVMVETDAFLRVGASASVGNVTLVLNNPEGLILSSVITNNVVFSNSGTISSTYADVDGSITIGSGVAMTTAANNLGTIPAASTPGRIVMDNNSTLAATATFTINQNQGITLQPGTAAFAPAADTQIFIASSITGDGELRKTGAGNIRLTGSNSYTGGTLIEQGIIGITSDSSLGAVTGRLKLDNGTIVAAQNNTGGPTNSGTVVNAARTIVLGNGTTNGIDAQTGLFFEYNGVIGEENGAGVASGLRFGIAGTREGTVRLGGLNTYDGSTTIVAGTLEFSNIADGGQASGLGQSGNAAGNLVIGGTLRYTGANGSTDRLFSIGSSGAGTIDSGSGSLAFTNTGALGFADTNITRHDLTLAGTGNGTMSVALVNDIHNDPLHLTKTGTGTWILLGANTYSGETTVSAGTLQVGNGGTAGALGSGDVANNGSLVFHRSDDIALGSAISGTGSVVKQGAGTLTLSGENSFSGGLSVLGGAVSVEEEGSLGAANNAITLDNGKLITTATVDLGPDRSVTFGAGGGTIDVATGTTATVDGVLGGSGNFTKSGAGILALDSASSTFAGATFINEGTLRLNDENVLASSAVTVASGATVTAAFGNAAIGNLSGAGNLHLAANATVGDLDASGTLSGAITGDGSLTKTGAGTLTLAGNNSHAGGVSVNGTGAVRAQNAAAFGTGSVTQADGTSKIIIDTTGTVTNAMSIYNVATLQTVTLSGDKTLNNATYDVTNNTTTTESGTLTGEGGITKLGTGTLLVTGDNTFTGEVDVQAGVLDLASSTGSAAGSTTNVIVRADATLLISQSNQVNNAATVSLSGGTITRGSGVSETFGALSLTAASTIDFGSGTAGTLSFGVYESGGTPSDVLTVNNFFAGNTLRFGSDLSSFISASYTGTSFSSTYFSINSTSGGFTSNWNGSTFTITAVPEPSTYVAAAGLLAFMLWTSRKRLLRLAGKRPATVGSPRI